MQDSIKVIGASKVFVCDEAFSILDNHAIAYNETIIEVGEYPTLSRKYGNATFHEDCVLLPSFINPHIHFEFSKNTTSFLYGGFDRWLGSVIAQRQSVLEDNATALQDAIDEQLKSGVGSVGAISSYGGDMEALAASPLKVVYFNEIIGSNPSAVDFLYSDFLARLESSQALASSSFMPAIALHSPYSVHFILAKKVLEIARAQNLPTSVHFLESKHEREWLEHSSGWFARFFSDTLKLQNPQSLYQIPDFIKLFEGLDTLFVHCLFATQEELTALTRHGTIITCPRSNRLLNNTLLDLDLLPPHKVALATDGKSSNNNLNFLDELRCALFGYPHKDCVSFSQSLLLSATNFAAKALRLNSGILAPQYDADFALFEVAGIGDSTQEALQLLLHAKQARSLCVSGKTLF